MAKLFNMDLYRMVKAKSFKILLALTFAISLGSMPMLKGLYDLAKMLSPEGMTETFEAIHRTHSATMVIISHQERIISLADEIIVVGGGELQYRGRAEDILPKIMSDTTGSCPVLTRKEAANP